MVFSSFSIVSERRRVAVSRYRRTHFQTVVDEQLPRLKKRTRRSLPGVYYCLATLCAVTAVLVLFSILFRPCTVQGNSMVPTLQDGDYLLLSNLNYEPAVGDIVAIRRDGDEPLIKRVIALGGDTLFIDPDSGKVYRNGTVLDEPYLSVTTPAVQAVGEITVPEGTLFVMGDNRPNSHDSRYNDIGPVALTDILGEAVWRLYPLSRFGSV